MGVCDRASATPSRWSLSSCAETMLFKATTACFASATCQHGEGTESLFVELFHLHQPPKKDFHPCCLFFPPLAGLLLGLGWIEPWDFGREVVECTCLQQDTGQALRMAWVYRSATTKVRAANYGRNCKGLSLSTLFSCGRVNISCCWHGFHFDLNQMKMNTL